METLDQLKMADRRHRGAYPNNGESSGKDSGQVNGSLDEKGGDGDESFPQNQWNWIHKGMFAGLYLRWAPTQ